MYNIDYRHGIDFVRISDLLSPELKKMIDTRQIQNESNSNATKRKRCDNIDAIRLRTLHI